MLPTPEQVKQYIETGLPCEHLEVEGDGQHFLPPSSARNLKASG